jgi:hypothetical protein
LSNNGTGVLGFNGGGGGEPTGEEGKKGKFLHRRRFVVLGLIGFG